MRISDILRTKGDEVVTVDPSATITEVLTCLDVHRVGAVVVSPDGRDIAGILSERDVVRRLARDGTGIVDLAAADLMTRDVITCRRDDSVDELMEVMTERRIRHVPVVDGQALAGIVSIGDVVKLRVTELEREARELHDYITTGR